MMKIASLFFAILCFVFHGSQLTSNQRLSSLEHSLADHASGSKVEIDKAVIAHEIEVGGGPPQLYEHLPDPCSSVTRIGTSDVPTNERFLIFLSKSHVAHPHYLDIHTNALPKEQLEQIKKLASDNHVSYQSWHAESLYVSLETTDLLVIDTDLTHDYLSRVLDLFSSRVRQQIYIKNATGPLEYRDDDLYSLPDSEYPKNNYRGCQGMRISVAKFLKQHPEWQGKTEENYTVLDRVASTYLFETLKDDRATELLKHKIVLCTGPSFHRQDLLKQVTEADAERIPFKKVFVVTNDPDIVNIRFKNTPSKNTLIH